MENTEKSDLFKYLDNEKELFDKRDRYYQVKVNLPNRPVSDDYIIKIEGCSEQETFDYIMNIITSKHEDSVDTGQWEEENGVEYEYNGSFTTISKTEYEVKLEDGIEEITT